MDIKEEDVLSDNGASEFFTNDVAVKREIEEQTLVSDFGSQNEGEHHVIKYNVVNEIEIKEESWWLEGETSTICDNIKDEDLKSSRLYAGTVSGDDGRESLLSSAEVSGRETGFYNAKDHHEYEHQKIDVALPDAEQHILPEQYDKLSDEREVHVTLLSLKQGNLISKGKSSHQCKICDKSFTRLEYLKKHNLIHKGKRPYPCKICDKNFNFMSHLKLHNMVHEGKKPHQCKICDKSFINLSGLKTHFLIHEYKSHPCKIYVKDFSYFSSLKTHK